MIAKWTCLILGAVFIIIAIWGFIDGDNVLIFHVNTAHNVVHLLSGAVAIACGLAGITAARAFCVIFGLVYGLVALLGFGGVSTVINLLHLNQADNWLHLFLAVAFLAAAAATMRKATPEQRVVEPPPNAPPAPPRP